MSTQETTSTGIYWMATLVSLIFTVGLMLTIPEWFWVGLPFLFTALVKAMNKM